MPPESSYVETHEKVGRLESDVHSLTKAVEKLFNKFDEFVDYSRPKQLGLATIISMVAAGLGSLAIIFGCVLYIVNSATAPIIAAINQQSSAMQSINTVSMQATNSIQLANKEITVVSNRAASNEQTIQWMLFDANLPKQLTEQGKDIAYIKEQLKGLQWQLDQNKAQSLLTH